MLKRLSIFFAASLWAGAAFAQYPGGNPQTVYQSGGVGSQITPRHPAMWITNGVIGDAGPASGGAAGTGFAELGITNTGTPFCINDVPVTSLTGYHQLCLGANALGGGLLSYQSYATAPILPFNFNIDGSVLLSMAPGAVTTITPQLNDSSTKIATTEFVNKQIQQGAAVLYPANSVLHYGADPTGVNDSGSAFTAAFAASCGTSLYFPPGTYTLNTIPSDPHCGVGMVLDDAATIHCVLPDPDTYKVCMQFSGAEGTATALTSDGQFNTMTFTVADPSAFCASGSTYSVPGCWARIFSDAIWDPGTLNHKRGELKPICGISGNTITLCFPLEDNYLVSDNAGATPVSMISGMSIVGGKVVGPAQNNSIDGIYIRLAYFPKVDRAEFYYFGRAGMLVCYDCWGMRDTNTRYYGIATGYLSPNNAYGVADGNASEWAVHDNIFCYQTGPCWTASFEGNPPSSTRHITVSNSMAVDITGFNSYAFQSHSMGADYVMVNNKVWRNDVSVSSACFSFPTPFVTIKNNECFDTSTFGIIVSNYTTGSGTAIITGNRISGAVFECIAVVQDPGAGPQTPFAEIRIDDNWLDGCGKDNIRLYANAHNKIVSVKGNHVRSPAPGFHFINLQMPQDFVVSGNIGTLLSGAGDTGIIITDGVNGDVSGNILDMPAGSTGIGIRNQCVSPSSGSGVTFASNSVSSPSPSNLRGIFNDNNCIYTNIDGSNSLSVGTTTPFVFGSGTGNRSNYVLTGATPSIGGSPLTAGTCTAATIVNVKGVSGAASISVGAEPVTYPGDATIVRVYGNGSDGDVDIKLCAIVNTTPTASVYNMVVTGQVNP